MLSLNCSKDAQRVLLYARYSTDKQNGRSRPVRADEGYTMHRDEPQMAHVTKDLWNRANAAIASRCNPLDYYNIPNSSPNPVNGSETQIMHNIGTS